MFESVEDVIAQLGDQDYLCDKQIATVVFLAQQLDKPVLVEGPAGVGKTELAKVVSRALGRDMIRLQCYEGLDEAKALYEWEYSKQLLYTQILKDKVSETIADSQSLSDAAERVGAEDSVFFSNRFIVPRPLMQAITSEKPTLLLIDEVDKSDPEFEAFLLEVLSDFQVTIPEIGTIEAKTRPLVFLTSNDAREMSDALKRRCLHLWIDYPSEELEVRILDRKVPNIDKRLAEEVVQLMNRIRELDLKKTPSISETLDWARSLLALNADELEDQIVSDTLNVILKYEGDVQKAQNELAKLIQKKTAEAQAEKPQPAPAQPVCEEGHSPLTPPGAASRGSAEMQKKVIEFTNLLRKSGIRVSVAEGIDAFNALEELSLDDREIFRDALRASMVKRGDEIATFDELFELFWSGFYDNLKGAFDNMEGALGEMGIDLEQLLGQLAEMMQQMDGDMDLGELAQALLTQDLSALENMIRQAAEQAGTARIENMLQVGFFSRRTTEQLGLEGAAQELEDLAERMRAQGMGEEQIQQMQELIRKLMETMRRAVRSFTERELQAQNHDYMEKFRREMLTEKSFYHLTEEEIARMREVVTRLAQRIKNILSIRKKRLKRGKLDLHQTLRRNMARGGIPFEVIYKQRRKDRPKLVILCDVSSSVANVSRFMLQFMYGLQEAFTKIRCLRLRLGPR